ncbi:MAG: S8 family serine peptidase [Candidatus Cloacimonadaceae bacterium]|jgi:subtilisin family serine protease/fibronectin type 3 domain-containing protein|nr:S8 family serine peptidase [Candidatus Cloacimonadota bacterium]MDX9949367.1 S8 family serine peptidase [Candidatus Syntrophosphaera sp.]
MTRSKIILTVIAILAAVSMFAAPQFGERPFIDIYKMPDAAMKTGHIRVKLSESHSSLAQSFSFQNGTLPRFGIEALDALNDEYNVTSITPVFGDFKLNKKWGWRHVEWGFHLWFQLEFKSETDIRDIVMAYRALDKDLQWAEPEYVKSLHHLGGSEAAQIVETMDRWTPNDPRYSQQWHYHNTGQSGGTPDADIDLPEAWDTEKGHPAVIIGIIDQGIQVNHSDLAGAMWTNPGEIPGNNMDDDGNGYTDDIHGYNFVQGSNTIDPGDHGCHVGGTVAAVNNNAVGVAGVAGGNGAGTGARLMTCQVFGALAGDGGFETAMVYAADNGAAINQNSWGYDFIGAYDQSVLDAIDYFNVNGGGEVMDGGITIFSAGNSNAGGLWYPGCYSGSFAVAATNNIDGRAWYSNYDTWIDVSAPGGDLTGGDSKGVLSCVSGNGYGFFQGTSMASPHVSGIAALVLSYTHRNGRTIDNIELANIIRNTTDDNYGVNLGFEGTLGTGRVNAHKALMAVDPTLPSCSITHPVKGQHMIQGSLVTVTATAFDTDGYITHLDFYLDDEFMATDSSAPYSWDWNTGNSELGEHIIKVVAWDNDGNSVERSVKVTLLHAPDEGFETGDFSLFPWQNNSSIPWFVQDDEAFTGSYAAKSGAINDNGSTSLSLTAVAVSAGDISFRIKVSSEKDYDWLRFYIDGEQKGQWSGSVNWTEVSYPVLAGPHTYTWTYKKDYLWGGGSDCAWLDHIIFPEMGVYYPQPQELVQTSGDEYVDLAWQVPALPGPEGVGPDAYKVYRDGSYLVTVTGLHHRDETVINNIYYDYYVTALYNENESDQSNTVTAYPTSNPMTTIIIGEGGGTQAYPLNRSFGYSSHEAVYLASQIGTACNIKSVGFNKAGGSNVDPIQNVKIYLKHTTQSSFVNGSLSTDGYTLVYNGIFPNNAVTGWMEVDLDDLFFYDGESNLAMLIVKGYQYGDTYNHPLWTYSSTSANQVRRERNDYSVPQQLMVADQLPNLKLQVYLPVGLFYPARNLSAEAGNGWVQLDWDAPSSGSPTSYLIYRDDSFLDSTNSLTYTDNSVTNGTTYSYYVVASYEDGDAEPSNIVEATPNASTFVIIGDGTISNDTNDGCPINVFYQSLHGQSVYTKSELNAQGIYGPITFHQVGFNVTSVPSLAMPNYVIRMGHTSAINAGSWIPESNLATVWSSASYRPTQTGWDPITLDTPFVWNGVDNIVLDTAFSKIGNSGRSGATQATNIYNGYRFTRNDGSDQTGVFSGGSTSMNRPNLMLVSVLEAPQELEAPEVFVEKSLGGVTISWNEVNGASGYNIYRALDPYGEYEYIGSTTSLTFEDTEVLDKAFYHVKAFSEMPAK